MCVLGWQSLIPGSANVCGSIFQALGIMVSDTYVPEAWHVAIITIAICTFAVIFNTFLARKMPGIEGFVFGLYILVFLALVIVLFSMGDRAKAEDVFTNFQDNANWGSIGTACFVSVSGPLITLTGADSQVHLAEELKDASRQLPKAMLLTAAVNYSIGLVTMIAIVFVVGDVEEVLATTTGQPWIQIVWNATQSKTPTLVFMAFTIFFLIFCAVNANTTSSRQIFAFARDGGLPFSPWISRVSPTKHVPINAVVLTWFIGCVIALIPLGSDVAFINIQTIGVAGLQTSYTLCILSRLYSRNFGRVYGNLSHPPPFFLGKVGGNVINSIALLFLICFLVSCTFPPVPRPSVEDMNWSSVALGGTITIALVTYAIRGKKYLGPHLKPVSDMAPDTVKST